MKRRALLALIPPAIAIAAGAVLLYFAGKVLAASLLLGLGAVAVALAFIAVERYMRRAEEELDDVFMQNAAAATRIVRGLSVPCLIFNATGRIVWRNEAFGRIYAGKRIGELLPALDVGNPSSALIAEAVGMNFQIRTERIEREGRENSVLFFQYWIDRTEAVHYRRIYEERMPCVALIYVDNFEELSQDRYFVGEDIMLQVEKYVAEFAEKANGIYVRYDSTRFLVVFEKNALEEMERSRFDILERVRSINTGTPLPVTLSISIGSGERLTGSQELTRQAMELALGRGGDQAVVKVGAKYAFYGGKRQTSSKTARVKTRLFSKALRQMIENAPSVFIMGHKRPDMDAMGAALGLYRCCVSLGKSAHIILDESNSTIQACIDAMGKLRDYTDCIITPEAVAARRRPNSLLIVVDAQRESSLLAPAVYDEFGKTVIIDHHRRAVDIITESTLSYMEPGASSTCEMVTEIIQYFDENLRPTPFECGAMLAGIIVDTKSFSINAGTRTFEAAGYLRRNGADMHMVKLMFQDDFAMYKNRTMVVSSAETVEGCVAISVCPSDVNDRELICAQAADELIGIKGILAAFVLVERDGGVHVSGRSLGDINVQLILERLGGGGHLTVAGAQITGATAADTLVRLKAAVAEYLAENPQTQE
ncbi:MAG: DHH family phosphoesterase [Clostridia bacterium]|nr:DHH family phosphoesterase [Clostridia bacterium]